ncbi:MAG TPA: aldose epimerase family protein [Streptosporangiaceae bacterium]|nr:aldose epimerase family protein [Streptosporangiaceae bacterium]
MTVVAAAAGAFGATAASAAPTRPAGHGGAPSVSSAPFGSTVEPYTGKNTPVERYTLSGGGVTANVLTFGAIIQSIDVPGRNGQVADVTLGFKTLADYVKNDSPPVTANGGPYFGESIGRYGNRIAKGTFTLNQPGQGNVTYHLPINNNGNTLHGGLVGFGNHIWSAKEVHGRGSAGVQLTLVSPNGDQGFPGTLKDVVTYTINRKGALSIHYAATDESKNLNTVINLTNHSYFNLAGENSPAGSAYSQKVLINANKYTPTDATQIPLGYNVSVKGTPFDFTRPKAIGAQIDDVSAPDNAPAADNQLLIAQGYDHNWVLNKQTGATTGPDGLNLAAVAKDPSSGRTLTVWTDQPGVQFYSGNFLTGTLTGISGNTYRQGAGYTFETQHFPNSPNQPNFPSTELKAGQTFNSTTIFAFSS